MNKSTLKMLANKQNDLLAIRWQLVLLLLSDLIFKKGKKKRMSGQRYDW